MFRGWRTHRHRRVHNGREPQQPARARQPAFGTVREDMQEQIKQDAKHFTGSVNIAYQPVTQVSLDATLGVDVVNQVSTDFAPFGYNVDNFISLDPDGYKFLDDRTRREITAEAKATWSTKLGDDFQSTLVGGGQGFFAKDQLAYRDWAFLTLGGRYDRNSAFGKTSQGVFYPKASISLQPSSLSSWSSSAWRSQLST